MAAKLCTVCNTRRPKTGSKGTETSPHNDMCNYCYEEGGWENTHNDANHDGIKDIIEHAGDAQLSEHDKTELQFMAECWICHPEKNLAQQPAKGGSTGTKAQGARRPQLNHKGHSHPATPAARRECKKAFWISMAKLGVTPATVTAEHFADWDIKVDGHGKPVAASDLVPTSDAVKKVLGWDVVVPRGPKGGVINQLKASKPSTK